jgi:hypothetical protein
MATTTIRVDEETHRTLLALSAANGSTLMATVREAADALRRQRFARQVAQELDTLKKDEAKWASYLAEAETTDVTDGVD